MAKERRFTNAELDAMAAVTEDWCPPWHVWQDILKQAKSANALRLDKQALACIVNEGGSDKE